MASDQFNEFEGHEKCAASLGLEVRQGFHMKRLLGEQTAEHFTLSRVRLREFNGASHEGYRCDRIPCTRHDQHGLDMPRPVACIADEVRPRTLEHQLCSGHLARSELVLE